MTLTASHSIEEGEEGMSEDSRFDDVPVWQNARALVGFVDAETNKCGFQRDFGLRDQIQRASVSSISNIVEGYERSATREFMHFLRIAKASAGGMRSRRHVTHDLKNIDETTFNLIFTPLSTSRQPSGFPRYLQQKETRDVTH